MLLVERPMRIIIACSTAIVAVLSFPATAWGQQYDGVLTGVSASDIAIAPSGAVYLGASNQLSRLLDPADLDAGVSSVAFPLLAGSGGAQIAGVAVDSSGNVYAAGTFSGTV